MARFGSSYKEKERVMHTNSELLFHNGFKVLINAIMKVNINSVNSLGSENAHYT